MPSSRKPTGKTRDLLPAAAKARTVELEGKKVSRPLSATTLRAIQREPAKGGSYSVLKTKEVPVPVCEVLVTTNAVHIEVGGKKLVLSPTEARLLAGKLNRALS